MRRSYVLLLLLPLFLPAADAALIGSYDFSLGLGVLDVRDLGGEGASNPVFAISLLSGSMHVKGERGGLFAFVDTATATVSASTKIEVINAADPQGAFERAARGECTSIESCAVERTFLTPTLEALPDSTMLMYVEGSTVNFTNDAPFALATLVEPPRDFGQAAFANLTIEQSVLAVSDILTGAGSVTSPTDNTVVYLPNNQSTVRITDPAGSKDYTGTQYVFRVYGTPTYQVSATALITPFAGAATMDFGRSSAEDLEEHFRIEAVNDVLRSLGSTGTAIPDQVAEQIRNVAPFLNGVIIGNATSPVINKETLPSSEISLVRFKELRVVAGDPSGAVAHGRSNFLLVGEGFYTTKSTATFGPVAVPPISFFLWIAAAGAIVAGFVLHPVLAPTQIGGFGLIRLIGIGFHLLALVLTGILWDGEIKAFLGTSLLTLFNEGATGLSATLGAVAAFEVVPFVMAYTAFCVPIRFIVNSGLKLGGLKKARGIGKGIGDLSIWGLGAPFIPASLNGIIGFVFDALKNALPGGA